MADGYAEEQLAGSMRVSDEMYAIGVESLPNLHLVVRGTPRSARR